jgi:Glycosyl transferase family 2
MTQQEAVLDRARPQPAGPLAAPQVEIVVPDHDEERDLGPSVRRLAGYLRAGFPFPARITIAGNGSTDGTWQAAVSLAAGLDEVRAVRMAEPGRGRAPRSIWSASDAAVLAYMDIDLSTGLNALLPLVAPLISGHSDVAIGTRLARGARVIRGPPALGIRRRPAAGSRAELASPARRAAAWQVPAVSLAQVPGASPAAGSVVTPR